MFKKVDEFKAGIKNFWVLGAGGIVLAVTAIFLLSTVSFGNVARLLPVYSVMTEEKKVALTFNCAWGTEDVDSILESLEEYDAKATFFLVGTWARDNPSAVKAIAKAGHEIGSHSNTHPDMTEMNKDKIEQELIRAEENIVSSGAEKPVLFRAPSGAYDNNLMETAGRLGYTVIQWDVDSRDWKNPEVDKMVRDVADYVENGSIVLMHCGAEPTAEALPKILEELSRKGYEFVKVSDLIYKNDYTIDNNGRQIKIKNEAS